MTMARRALVFALLLVFSAIGPDFRAGSHHRRRFGRRRRHHRNPWPASFACSASTPLKAASSAFDRPANVGDADNRASFALADRIGRATVSCQPRDLDRYGRVVAVCFKGNEDLNRWMVATGWAVAYQTIFIGLRCRRGWCAIGVRLISGPAASTCRGIGGRNTTIEDSR